VQEIDDTAKRILVEPAPAGRVPKFEGEAAPLNDKLTEEMRAVYLSSDEPPYLDKTAKRHLAEGRQEFFALGLDTKHWAAIDGRLYLFPWVGSHKLDTLRLALRYCGLQSEQGRIAVSSPILEGLDPLFQIIRQLSRSAPPADALALLSANLRTAKYDNFLPVDLLREAFARERLDLEALMDVCGLLATEMDQNLAKYTDSY
jgi:ATP-dependent Lhr-like helicase